jgi:hypothetical protein
MRTRLAYQGVPKQYDGGWDLLRKVRKAAAVPGWRASHRARACACVCVQVWASEGPRGYFRGMLPTLVQVAPQVAVTVRPNHFIAG